jgi:hypothetical protein
LERERPDVFHRFVRQEIGEVAEARDRREVLPQIRRTRVIARTGASAALWV